MPATLWRDHLRSWLCSTAAALTLAALFAALFAWAGWLGAPILPSDDAGRPAAATVSPG